MNAVKTEWLQTKMQDNDPSPIIMPLHYAIKRQLETGEDQAWIAGWAAVTEIATTHAPSALVLGTQFYRECLLNDFC